jgi:hypothetical protein
MRYHTTMILYALVLFVLLIYSYCLIDPNITFMSHPWWVMFRDQVVYIGYHQRPLSWQIYLGLVLILFLFHFYFVKKYQKMHIGQIALLVGGILLLAYPFLSHDFFNYMFDAKIATFYHQNPYLKKALDFPQDDWIRFMHWTHRAYPYGPSFLLITLIPSFLSMGKFTFGFVLFKAMFVSFYLLAVYVLQKLHKKWAIIFATHPLIIFEGLVSSHNDLIAVSLGLIGIYFLFTKKQLWGRVFLLVSGGIKYVTMPAVILTKKNYFINTIVGLSILALVGYVSSKLEIQPWYFLVFFMFLPYYEGLISKLTIFFAGLLFSYYPYIYLGGWDSVEKLTLKHNIMWTFAIANAVYLCYFFWRSHRQRNSLASEVLSSKEHI